MDHKKFWFQIIGLVIVILGASFFAFNYRYIQPFTSQFASTKQPKPQAIAGLKNLKIVDSAGNVKTELNVEIASTNESRNKGLGNRSSLDPNSGMFFFHDQPKKYTYWMKGMQFPIDIMWISNDEIVDIIANVPPPIPGQSEDTLERYSSTVEVNRVLETNAGFVEEKNIQKGDKIILEQ